MFNYDEYLEMMTKYHHNFIHFWWEEVSGAAGPVRRAPPGQTPSILRMRAMCRPPSKSVESQVRTILIASSSEMVR